MATFTKSPRILKMLKDKNAHKKYPSYLCVGDSKGLAKRVRLLHASHTMFVLVYGQGETR